MVSEIDPKTASRDELRAIYKGKRGSMADVAAIAGVSDNAVSMWLSGKFPGPELERPIRKYAARLLRAANR